MRAAASVAFDLMKGSADQVPVNDSQTSILPNVQSTSILAPQRYRVQSSGTGIEFDPSDPLYGYVTNKMKAQLAFVQIDATVAKFLSDGLKAAFAADDGHSYPHLLDLPALRDFSFKGSTTTHIRDASSADDSHYATVSSHAWCNTTVVTIAATVDKSWQFAPLEFDDINMWRSSVPSSFRGSSHEAATPFNGPGGSNPYLIVSVDGHTEAFKSYPYVNCWNNSGFRCTSTIEVDPVPYSEPGAYYGNSGQMVGTQSNPFAIVGTLYATSDHMGQWATRTVNGIQEWGTFTTPWTIFGFTEYKYSKMM